MRMLLFEAIDSLSNFCWNSNRHYGTRKRLKHVRMCSCCSCDEGVGVLLQAPAAQTLTEGLVVVWASQRPPNLPCYHCFYHCPHELPAHPDIL